MSTHHFDILHAWARLSDEEVLDRFDNQAAMVLKEIASDLDAASARQDVTNENFVSLVRRLRTLYEERSRELSRAVLEAGTHRDAGRVQDAKEVLVSFASRCESPFYRDIALGYANKGE